MSRIGVVMEDDNNKLNRFDLGVHLGNILHVTAHTYGEPPTVLREFVQNSIDKKATHILISVDALHRTIKVFDDGLGASDDEIRKKFGTVARSLKIDADDIGEKGIGNLAGLSIAETYHLTTKAKESAEPFRRYSLHQKNLMGQEKVSMDVEIWPGKGIGGGIGFTASTLVQLVDVNERALRRLNNVEVIERVLLEAFSKKIRDNKIDIRVAYVATAGKGWEKKIEPGKFRGTKLPAEVYETKYGTVTFEMYYSLRSLDKPNLVIEHRDKYSIALANLSHPMVGQLNPKAWDVFKKGYFEGIIKLNFGTLTPDRGSFQWDDEMVALSDAIEEFAVEILHPLINRVEEEHREEKYRKISDEILKKITSFYQEHPDMRPDFLRDVEVTGNPDDNVSTGGPKPLKPPKPPKPPVEEIIRRQRIIHDGEKKNPNKDNKATPGTTKNREVSGVKLARRVGNVMHISYVLPEEEFGVSWYSRRVDATIEINIQNSDFGIAETLGNTKLRDYVSILVNKELTCAVLDPTSARGFSERFEDTFMPYYRASLEQ